MVEISEVKSHFTPPGCGDLNQPAAQGETLEGAGEHDAADQIEDDVRAFSPGRRANFPRQVLGGNDQLLGYGVDRRVRMRRMPVSADDSGAKASSDLGGGGANAASGADQQQGLLRFQGRRFDAAPGGHVVDPNRRRLVEAEVSGLATPAG